MNQICPTLSDFAEEACERVGFQSRHIAYKWDWTPPGAKEPYQPAANKALWERFSPVHSIAEAPSFFLSGSVGCGKTGLLSAYCKVLFLNLEPKMSPWWFSQHVRYIQHDDLNNIFRDIENGQDAIEELTNIELLILDEFAAEKDTDWVLKELQRLIDRRWANNRPTWFASNHTKEELRSWKGWERIVDRLFDRSWCRYAELKGSFREKVK